MTTYISRWNVHFGGRGQHQSDTSYAEIPWPTSITTLGHPYVASKTEHIECCGIGYFSSLSKVYIWDPTEMNLPLQNLMVMRKISRRNTVSSSCSSQLLFIGMVTWSQTKRHRRNIIARRFRCVVSPVSRYICNIFWVYMISAFCSSKLILVTALLFWHVHIWL